MVAASSAVGLELGSAKLDITPPVGYPMEGYEARTEGSTGVHDPLLARVLVLKDGETALAIVSCDLAEFPSERVVRQAREKFGIQHVLLAATHTHGGPRILLWNEYGPSGIDMSWPTPERSWFAATEERILSAIGDASMNLEPVTLTLGQGAAELGYNRRQVGSGGKVRMLWQNPGRIPTQPVDPRVGVLLFRDARRHVRAVVVNYACHAVVLGPDNRALTADFPGVMCEQVEKQLGGKAICLFVQGAAGDINPLEATVPVTEGGFEAAQRAGMALARNVQGILDDLRDKEGGECSIRAMQDVVEFPHRWKSSQRVRLGMVTLLLGLEAAVVTLPGEPFIEFQIDLAARSSVNTTLLFGYTYTGEGAWADYLPTIRAAAEGGYGAGYNTYLAVGTGESLINRALVRIYTALGALRDKPVVTGD